MSKVDQLDEPLLGTNYEEDGKDSQLSCNLSADED